LDVYIRHTKYTYFTTFDKHGEVCRVWLLKSDYKYVDLLLKEVTALKKKVLLE